MSCIFLQSPLQVKMKTSMETLSVVFLHSINIPWSSLRCGSGWCRSYYFRFLLHFRCLESKFTRFWITRFWIFESKFTSFWITRYNFRCLLSRGSINIYSSVNLWLRRRLLSFQDLFLKQFEWVYRKFWLIWRVIHYDPLMMSQKESPMNHPRVLPRKVAYSV